MNKPEFAHIGVKLVRIIPNMNINEKGLRACPAPNKEETRMMVKTTMRNLTKLISIIYCKSTMILIAKMSSEEVMLKQDLIMSVSQKKAMG